MTLPPAKWVVLEHDLASLPCGGGGPSVHSRSYNSSSPPKLIPARLPEINGEVCRAFSGYPCQSALDKISKLILGPSCIPLESQV